MHYVEELFSVLHLFCVSLTCTNCFLLNVFQIMDPKMDSGIACTYYSLDEAIENGVAPVPISADKTTDVRCMIDIMDHLLACEVFISKGA